MTRKSFLQEVAEIPKLARGKVWCTKCGAEQSVSASHALVYGWPTCCGYTMTIDSPEERAPTQEPTP